ncbi:MAG: glycosyltransferase [Candidatus Bathyarchaeia archaeon]
MRVVYIALDPLRYPRIRKIALTLRKYGNVEFDVMMPKFRVLWQVSRVGRFLAAAINYVTVLLQVLFIRGDFFWVANCPDILVFPLVLRRKRYILEYRSPWSIEVENEFGRGPWVRLTAFFERFALKHAWIVTLTTSRLMERVKAYGKPVFVIPNYPLKTFGMVSVPVEEFRKRCGCREGDKVVLFVGKLTLVEGAGLLPKIMEDVLKRVNVVFWIVGGGPLYSMLEGFAKRFPEKVKLFGWQPHASIPNFIAAADVCIAPRYKSPFSVFYNEEGVSKFSEYMFFEKPIVACGVAESGEYLLVDEDGMADGILKALHGEVRPSRRRTWEDHSEKKIYEMFSLICSGKI